MPFSYVIDIAASIWQRADKGYFVFQNIKRDYEALFQRHQEEGVENDSHHNQDSATSEIFKIKDHLISVERKVEKLKVDL